MASSRPSPSLSPGSSYRGSRRLLGGSRRFLGGSRFFDRGRSLGGNLIQRIRSLGNLVPIQNTIAIRVRRQRRRTDLERFLPVGQSVLVGIGESRVGVELGFLRLGQPITIGVGIRRLLGHILGGRIGGRGSGSRRRRRLQRVVSIGD